MLIVIDMQPAFSDAVGRAKQGCIEVVRQARALNMPIALVEYDSENNGHTIGKIAKEAGYYHRIEKPRNDGSADLIKYFGQDLKQAYLCGVYGDYCVRETYESLSRHGIKVALLPEAIAGYRHGHPWQFRYRVEPVFASLPSVEQMAEQVALAA